MTPYQNQSGKSGVAAYEIGPSHIDVRFTDGAIYRYTTQSAGQANLDQMTQLARAGRGLNTFINQVVKQLYSKRLK